MKMAGVRRGPLRGKLIVLLAGLLSVYAYKRTVRYPASDDASLDADLARAMLGTRRRTIGLVIGLADFTLDSPILCVACMAVLSAGLLFLRSARKLRPIGAILAMIIGFGLDELGVVHSGELATRGLLYAWLMVAIPIGANVVVNLAVDPSPRRPAGDRPGPARWRAAHGRLAEARPLRGQCERHGRRRIRAGCDVDHGDPDGSRRGLQAAGSKAASFADRTDCRYARRDGAHARRRRLSRRHHAAAT